jgi:S-adenosylmethionine synthetase
MIRIAEGVLPGHPDKFCDQIADAIVCEAMTADPEAFAQIEVGICIHANFGKSKKFFQIFGGGVRCIF